VERMLNEMGTEQLALKQLKSSKVKSNALL
jgi:hypothetical protein